MHDVWVLEACGLDAADGLACDYRCSVLAIYSRRCILIISLFLGGFSHPSPSLFSSPFDDLTTLGSSLNDDDGI